MAEETAGRGGSERSGAEMMRSASGRRVMPVAELIGFELADLLFNFVQVLAAIDIPI